MNSQRGFTIVEIITTLIIVGILAIVSLGRLDFINSFSQKGFYDKVMASIEFARKQGVAHRRSVCIRTSGNIATFTFDTRTPETAGAVFCDGTSETPLAMAVADSNCGGATNEVCAPSGGALTSSASPLIFDANGGYSGATNVTFGPTGYTITVEAGSGYVH